MGYLVSVRNMKFLKPVVPGDQLELHVQIGKSLGVISQVEITAYVDKRKLLLVVFKFLKELRKYDPWYGCSSS